jgi:hypothetical protein
MSGFVFHPAALSDLEEIWEYIAADSPDAADRVLEEITMRSAASSHFHLLAISVQTLPNDPCVFIPCEIF